MFVERRRANRIKKTLMVQHRCLDGTECWDVAEARDFSELGLHMVTQRSFEPHTKLRLRIKLPSNPFQSYELDGQVVASDKCRARIEITRIDQDARDVIRQYVAWYLSRADAARGIKRLSL